MVNKDLEVKVAQVQAGGIAEELGIEPNDVLVSINHRPVADLLDYMDLMLEEVLTLQIQKPDGQVWDLTVEKDVCEDLGMTFEPELMDRPKSCKNKCVFCFIDQLPKGMRSTVYFKDDDWRLSYLYGNYVTFTNVTKEELDRICERRYSPMFLSVHSMRPELRVKMMKNPKAAEIIALFERFQKSGIMLNCQLVLCPGINDGEELEYSLSKLFEYAEIVDSVAVVPVGLTGHREGLTPLTPYTKEQATRALQTVHQWQQRGLKEYGRRIVFASDEFYIKAELETPSYDALEDFAQIENGVGLVTRFAEEFSQALENTSVKKSPYSRVVIATGVSAYPFMCKIAQAASEKLSVRIDVYEVKNHYFGGSVTVAGLLTGQDLEPVLKECGDCDFVMLAGVMFRAGTQTFLDNMTADELSQRTGKKIKIVDVDGSAFVQALTEPATVKKQCTKGKDACI